MNGKSTQIRFAPKIDELNEMGIDWYNVVLDVIACLEKNGFIYSRTRGFINDKELSQGKLLKIVTDISDNIVDMDCFLYFEATIIGSTQDMAKIVK